MEKNLINPGDTVVFAQRYLDPKDPLRDLYDDEGIVVSMTDTHSTVRFRKNGIQTVPTVDLDRITIYEDDDDLIEDVVQGPDLELMEDHELGGMQKAQLIAHKLLAQETDPKLNREINQLLN